MAEIELHRITDGTGAALCEEIYAEYVDWVFERSRQCTVYMALHLSAG